MPSAPLRPCCGSPTCPNLVTRGRCKDHAVQQEHQRGNYAMRRLYRTARWKHPIWGLRTQVLRDNPLCIECEAEHKVVIATDVHHKVKPGTDQVRFFDRQNLEGLCARHHSAHTAKGE